VLQKHDADQGEGCDHMDDDDDGSHMNYII
jgi:hypothetical protein